MPSARWRHSGSCSELCWNEVTQLAGASKSGQRKLEAATFEKQNFYLFAECLIHNAAPRVWVVVNNEQSSIYVARIYVARTLGERRWKFAEILPRMKNLEERFVGTPKHRIDFEDHVRIRSPVLRQFT